MNQKLDPIEEIPEHLKPFIAEQDASKYTPIDHAAWRYIMRVSIQYFKTHAHQAYLDGLESTGISTERIPLISEMDEKMRKLGWRAVPVVGFIPPAIFMEFQSLGILPIACDMRSLEHIAYTPAPDIVHEAAGHAPMINDPGYAEYLRAYGGISRKAIFSKNDMEVYFAIRKLSDIKESTRSTKEDISIAESELEKVLAANEYTSEAAYLARMNWWTVEYGLFGKLEDPFIYGAGLLSSVGESHSCLNPEVRKIPFTIDCVNLSYDITRPQPQLFVVENFRILTEVLEEFAKTMAFHRGGVEGLAKAKMAQSVTTTVLDSGLQVSSVLNRILFDEEERPCYLHYNAPTQLAYQDEEIENHGANYHKEGFGTPLGFVKGTRKTAAHLSEADCSQGRIEFESGVVIEGEYKSSIKRGRLALIHTFENCTVTYADEVLFRPEWGTFDMGCGSSDIVSVFGHAADRAKYLAFTGENKVGNNSQVTNLTKENRELNQLYEQLREVRDQGGESKPNLRLLESISSRLSKSFPNDWLLRLELIELASKWNLDDEWLKSTKTELKSLLKKEDLRDLIEDGLNVIEEEILQS